MKDTENTRRDTSSGDVDDLIFATDGWLISDR